MKRALVALTMLIGLQWTPGPASAAVACASLATMEACVACGEAKYGHDAQVRHCQANWHPGAKRREWTAKDEAAAACAKRPTMQACIECGSAAYGYEKQVAYCRNHWKSGR
jgi:hypothetical protein